jgi:preprotein translocase subunit SecE
VEEILPSLRQAPVAQRVEVTEQSHAIEQSGGGRIGGGFRRVRDFLVNVRAELAKVSWPTREELVKATRMVVVLSLIIGVVLGLLDRALQLILVDGIAALAR